MTTRTWDGTTNSFNSATDWSPNGVPVSGDTAVINAGTVSTSGTISGVAIQLNEQNGATASTTIALNSTTLDAASALTVINSNVFNGTAPTINVTGRSVLAGVTTFSGTQVTVAIASGATLVNTGTMSFNQTSPTVSGAGTLENDGAITFTNPNGVTQIPNFLTPITGTGTISLSSNARIAVTGATVGTQTVVMNGGSSGNEVLEVDQVSTFKAAISGFSPSDLIAVINTPYTAATYQSTGSNSGSLNLYSGSTLEGSLNFIGSYTLSSFTLKFNDFGGGQSNLQITTTGSGSTSSGSSGSGSGGTSGSTGSGTTTVGAVYRFFDKNTGTHFFTSDVGERNTTLTLSNYVQETNDFGNVAQSDTNGEAVYRFFDTKFGTHFFTASASERDTVIATRSDLVYEPNSTFYEHATQQSGDVPVYRFFDTQFGTHFYTGDATEAATTATLKVAGTNQAAYTAEGVGFYAPSGSFT